MEPYKDGNLKRLIKQKALKEGAAIVGFASVSRWEEYKETASIFYPRNVYPFAKTVVVLGIPILIPMLETTPSIVYSELYNTTNRLLDEIAYELSVYISGKNVRTAFFPRDGYGDISVLVKQPAASFSHVLAGKYAGLGTIGFNHTLLTKEFGPRVRLVSILIDADLEPDDMQDKDLCTHCGVCGKCCPTNAFLDIGKPIAYMNKHKCARYHEKLREKHRYPCGVCIKVCPVGADRKLYGNPIKKYLQETAALKENPNDPTYADWTHVRAYGSKPLETK
jgi:epoxyqueuosine reductase